MASNGSVFFREHHCEDTRRDRRIGRVRRHQVDVCVVVINFPEAADIAAVDETKIVLTVRIVVFVEVIERTNFGENRMTPIGGKGFKAPTTVPPTNERRKASLSARIRSRKIAFSAVIVPRRSCGKEGTRWGSYELPPVLDRVSIVPTLSTE